MISVELQNALQKYENYINQKGIDEELINAYLDSVKWAFYKDNDKEIGLALAKKTKNLINEYVLNQTGGDIYALERYAQQNKTEYDVLNIFYETLRQQAAYDVKAFFEYIEIDTEQAKRFYYPRKHTLSSILNAYQEVYDGKLDFLSVSQPKRTGKCVEENTLVCTPYGFRPIKDIHVGDFIISADGTSTRVIGVYPQEKELDVYEVEITESGKSEQKTVIECCENHLWEVSTEDSRYKNKPGRVMSTLEIFNGSIKRGKDKHNNYAIKYIEPVEFEKRKVNIDPWLLGVLIGDGCLSGKSITFSNVENDIVEKVEKIARYDHNTILTSIGNAKDYRLCYGNLREELDVLNLIGARSENKFIPKMYLYNDIETRVKILQGLCDTDGYCEEGGIEYSTVSRQLADDIQFLVKSLGGKISCKEKQGYYRKAGQKVKAQKYYRLYINFPSEGICPVSSNKHLKKYKPIREKMYHFINDVRKTNKKAKMICLEVEHESHLYCITENFILTHNTTSGLRLSLMMGGNKPDGCIFATGKGEGLVKSFFGGINETFDDAQMYQRYLDVFPNAVKVGQNADELTIHLGKKRRFATFTCRPIDGSIVGNTEANVLLYIDDCVKNHEEARNRDRLEFLCEKVTDDVLGRRIEGTPIIIQGTKYSLYDPITHLQNKADEMGWRWKEVAIPALDPITDESNWEIEKDGKKIFTTKYYQQERVLVTEETWAAEFQQEPFEAKGRMFPEKELNYFEKLPIDREPDAIMAACDSADDGEDSCSMPIGYVYGNEVYIVDVVFDNAGTQFTKPECANMLIKHNVKTVTFESNRSGEYFGRDVMQLVEEQGGRCSARYKYNCSNKITRMENARDNIIRDYYFRDFRKMDRNSQYYKFMKEFTTMTRSGKVKHDDAPDSLALFENEMRSGTVKPARIIQSPI